MSRQMESPSLTFGPVPSRRFGQSLGLNTIPPKTCSYSCVYCQVGKTNRLTIRRERLCEPAELAAHVTVAVARLRERQERVDYLTFVPDGEPTLDTFLGEQLRALRPLGIPIAVITNASLLSREDVRRDLDGADRVSVKVDAVRHETWRRIDRPHGDLRLAEVLDGVLQFARSFKGELDTETMLVSGVNDSIDDLQPLATFLARVAPARAYVSIPTRPPAVEGVLPATEEALVRAYEALSTSVPHVELLTGYEGTEFASSGDARADLLAITAVHPMRADQVQTLLDRCGATWDAVEWLVRQQSLKAVTYGSQRFYLRTLGQPWTAQTK
jgi:wyosine [tRNA(Phe)-imidazoG37] synthetase (radical SAM superfamily)